MIYLVEKSIVVNILEDIEQCLYSQNWQSKTLSTVEQYKKGLMIAIDENLKKQVEEYQKYDENSLEAIKLSKQINERLKKIYNKKDD